MLTELMHIENLIQDPIEDLSAVPPAQAAETSPQIVTSEPEATIWRLSVQTGALVLGCTAIGIALAELLT